MRSSRHAKPYSPAKRPRISGGLVREGETLEGGSRARLRECALPDDEIARHEDARLEAVDEREDALDVAELEERHVGEELQTLRTITCW